MQAVKFAHRPSWQEQLKGTFNNILELCEYLNIDSKTLEYRLNLNPKFPLRVPQYYANKIAKNNPNDPLLLQVLPSNNELKKNINYCSDPLEEAKYTQVPGLIHKYKTRVLLTLTSACGINCRYCFRQNFPYSENIVSNKQRFIQLDYINKNTQINEVIFSGGDPLCVSNKHLTNIIEQISSIKHIKFIRFHSRMPIVIPDRIDNGFIDIINNFKNIKFILVTHCNHPDELDSYIKSKMKQLRDNNVTILNQSVLLNNINNNPETLIELSYKLFDCHIMPYYLHLLDKVTGTEHFDIEKSKAIDLIHQVKAHLPGYLVPKLAQELPGELSKTIIC